MSRFVIGAVCVLGTIAETAAVETVDVGKDKQLLVDDFVVDQLTGLSRVVQQPQRISDRPILVPEQPWEGSVLQMPCVLWDPQQRIYHMDYSGWKKEHGAKDNEAAIGLATLPLDRFVAIAPQERRGSLTTKPFLVQGQQLQINANATGGELRIEVLTEAGELIAGYDAACCEPITTDELRAAVKWRDRSLKALNGRTIRLRFQIDQAQLFAFQLQ